MNAAATAEEEERHFQDHRARAEEEKRRELDHQKRMKEKNSSLFEGKRKQERREEAGRGVRSREKGEGKADQWAKNAEKMRTLKKEREAASEYEAGRRRTHATQLGGNLPNQCRAPVLDVLGQVDNYDAGESAAADLVQSSGNSIGAPGRSGFGKKKKKKKGAP